MKHLEISVDEDKTRGRVAEGMLANTELSRRNQSVQTSTKLALFSTKSVAFLCRNHTTETGIYNKKSQNFCPEMLGKLTLWPWPEEALLQRS